MFNQRFTGMRFATPVNRYGFDSEGFTQEFRFNSNGDGRFNWTTGVFYRDEYVDNYELETEVLGPFVLSFDNPSNFVWDNQSWALFGDISYLFGDRWELGVGIRYFTDERVFEDRIRETRQEDTFDDTSPRVYARFAATDDISIYANIAQGFRSGGFNPPEAVDAGGPNSFGPENVTSYELGTKMQLAEGRLFTEFVLFQSDYDDMQFVGLIPGVRVNVTSNLGTAEIRGFEWGIVWNATQKLTLGFNGSVIDTEITELRAESTSHNPGDPLDQVAEHGWSLTLGYFIDWSKSTPGYIRAAYNSQGPIQWTNRAAGLLHPVGRTETLGFLSAQIGVIFGRTTIELFGRNLLDEVEFLNPYHPCCAISAQGRRRAVGLRVGYNFE